LWRYSDDLTGQFTARQELSIRIAAQQTHTERVLDVGCANGWFEYLCRERLHAHIDGIDVGCPVLEAARRNAPHATYTKASVLSLPFADGTFDGAVMFEVIEHLPRRSEDEALREIRRVLKPNAWFLLSTPFANPVAVLLDPAWYVGHRHYTVEGIVALLESASFRVQKTLVRGGLWELCGVFWFYLFKWLFNAQAPLQDVFERRRAREFLEEREGISNIFVLAVAS
jgi:ubiquinone/menaquinone biosynthesis C-methylase UbiE